MKTHQWKSSRRDDSELFVRKIDDIGDDSSRRIFVTKQYEKCIKVTRNNEHFARVWKSKQSLSNAKFFSTNIAISILQYYYHFPYKLFANNDIIRIIGLLKIVLF